MGGYGGAATFRTGWVCYDTYITGPTSCSSPYGLDQGRGSLLRRSTPRPLFLLSGARGCPRTGGGKYVREKRARRPRGESYPRTHTPNRQTGSMAAGVLFSALLLLLIHRTAEKKSSRKPAASGVIRLGGCGRFPLTPLGRLSGEASSGRRRSARNRTPGTEPRSGR